MKEKSLSELAYEILARTGLKGMHYKELTRKILLIKPIKSKSPEQTILGVLVRDHRFERVKKGVYRIHVF